MTTYAQQIAELKEGIVDIGRRLYATHMIVATDGNVSVRIGERELMVTRSGICKGELTVDDVITVDFDGNVVGGDGKPSSEVYMHIACYEERDDIAAIVHAHPPTAVAFSLAGHTLAQCIVPEVVLTMGAVPTIPYTTPTTQKVPDAIRPVIRHCDALMLERHGAVCVGVDLKDAYFKMEKVEHAAHVTHMAHQLGGARTLPPEEVKTLIGLRGKFDLAGRNPLCNDCIVSCFGQEEAKPVRL